MPPTVSIITPTYNRSHKLNRAIQSVLRQSYQDYEMIIVDDGSTDDTETIVARYDDSRIKYINLGRNTGGSMIPRQTGLDMSRGKYIAVLDDDDFWVDDNKLLLQVSYLDKESTCVLVGTDAVAVDQYDKVLLHYHYPQDDNDVRNKLLVRNCFFHSSVMYRKAAIIDLGGYKIIKDGYYSNSCNEYDLWLKMGLVGELANLPIYGVGFTYPPAHIKYSHRLSLLKLHLNLIREYKPFYPNCWKAVFSTVVVTMLEFPMLSPLKKYLRRFRI